MEREERCGTCRFWVKYEQSEADSEVWVGPCLRFPPPRSPDDLEVSRFPRLWSDSWCGEWQARKPLPVVEPPA